MNILKRVNRAVIISEENSELLGLQTGLTVKGTTRSEFTDIRNDKGYILNKDGIKEFNLPEITEIDSSIVIYSKDISWGLKPFFEENSSLSEIIELVNFLNELKNSGINLDNFSHNLFYRNSDNEIFILPPKIIYFLNSRRSTKTEEEYLTKYSHPDLKGERAITFSIGILLFEKVTSSYPIDYNSVEDLRDKFRRNRLFKPRWKNALVSDALNNLLEELLNIESEKSLSNILLKLIEVEKNGLYREVNNIDSIEKANNRKLKRFIKTDNLRFKIIKNSSKILVSTFFIVVLSIFAGTVIRNSLRPPSTVGFSKVEILNSYFKSFDTIDVGLIEDVLQKDVRDVDIKEITSRHITLAYRIQSSGTDSFYTPDDWLLLSDEDKSIKDVFGMNNIIITPVDDNSFKISYDKWYSTPSEADSVEDIRLITYKESLEEIFTLTQTKYSYEISKIETISKKVEKIW